MEKLISFNEWMKIRELAGTGPFIGKRKKGDTFHVWGQPDAEEKEQGMGYKTMSKKQKKYAKKQ